MEPIYILCLSTAWGGLEMNTVKIAKHLATQNGVVLICTEDTPIAQKAIAQNIPLLIVPKGLSLWQRAKWLIAPIKDRIQRAQAHKALVLSTDNKTLKLLAILKTWHQLPLVVMYQQHMIIGVKKRDWYHNWLYRQIGFWLVPIPALEENARAMTTIHPSKLRMVPIGIETEKLGKMGRPSLADRQAIRAQFGMKEGVFYIGILGRLDPTKGQDQAVKAITRLAEEGYPVALWMMGNPTIGEWEQYVHELQQAAATYACIHLLPFNTDIRPFFDAIDLKMVPSAVETYGMVTLEAQYCGTPVMAIQAGGSTDLLQHGAAGILLPDNQADTIYRALKNLLEQPDRADLLAQKSAKALESIDRYTLAEEMKLIRAVLSEASKTKP